jgi:hypothetical protein
MFNKVENQFWQIDKDQKLFFAKMDAKIEEAKDVISGDFGWIEDDVHKVIKGKQMIDGNLLIGDSKIVVLSETELTNKRNELMVKIDRNRIYKIEIDELTVAHDRLLKERAVKLRELLLSDELGKDKVVIRKEYDSINLELTVIEQNIAKSAADLRISELTLPEIEAEVRRLDSEIILAAKAKKSKTTLGQVDYADGKSVHEYTRMMNNEPVMISNIRIASNSDEMRRIREFNRSRADFVANDLRESQDYDEKEAKQVLEDLHEQALTNPKDELTKARIAYFTECLNGMTDFERELKQFEKDCKGFKATSEVFGIYVHKLSMHHRLRKSYITHRLLGLWCAENSIANYFELNYYEKYEILCSALGVQKRYYSLTKMNIELSRFVNSCQHERVEGTREMRWGLG